MYFASGSRSNQPPEIATLKVASSPSSSWNALSAAAAVATNVPPSMTSLPVALELTSRT